MSPVFLRYVEALGRCHAMAGVRAVTGRSAWMEGGARWEVRTVEGSACWRVKVELDENIPRSARQVLIAAGHDVDTLVEENLAGVADPQVVAAAAAKDDC